ncbi:hypothetical protein [Paenibacillus contaminans]|uniref:Uncharacterized protein n=1 Tax=Paenibacillus contaminans TaxID=450362 RepID=A0A329MPX0_9BACL|nr:hypothetical protein [Paenibacillus contaminans]RAV21652.1 hypothetical protein DQG23_10395 [Paenibacillus contaminans]
MEFIKPIQKLKSKVEWQISNRTKTVVKYYAEYTGLSEDEVVDRFLDNIRRDPEFYAWIHNKRRKAHIIKQIFPENQSEVNEDEYGVK